MRRKLTALVALTTTACTGWRVQPGPAPANVQAASESHSQKPIRLNFKGGAFAEIYEPAIVGDSIIGMNRPANEAGRERVAFATADVESVATTKIAIGKTVLAITAITVATLMILGAGASSSSSSSSSSNSSCAAITPAVALSVRLA